MEGVLCSPVVTPRFPAFGTVCVGRYLKNGSAFTLFVGKRSCWFLIRGGLGRRGVVAGFARGNQTRSSIVFCLQKAVEFVALPPFGKPD